MRDRDRLTLRRDGLSEGEAPPAIAPHIAPKDRLRASYGLTAAEARVALLMGDGLTVSDIAARSSNSVHTVRAQLSAVFAKTGCHRQADLVRLLLLGGIGRAAAVTAGTRKLA